MSQQELEALHWLSSQLARMLGFEDPSAAQDMADYVATMDTPAMIDYLGELLGSGPGVDSMVGEFNRRRGRISMPGNMQVYRKKSDEDQLVYGAGKGKGKGKASGGSGGGGVHTGPSRQTGSVTMSTAKPKAAPYAADAGAAASFVDPNPFVPEFGGDGGAGGGGDGGAPVKKPKKGGYVSLTSAEGAGKLAAEFLSPGQRECGCCATKHKLINNCLSCGRIVCAQEGSGPCLTLGCDALVCTPAEQEAILRGSRKGNDLKKKILRESEERAIQAQAAAVKEAKARKDRLLHYQSTSAKRMTVIDDESDYFSHDSNRWMSAEGKAKLKKKEEGMRAAKEKAKRSMTIQLDFAGRKITDYDASQDLDGMYDHGTHEHDDPNGMSSVDGTGGGGGGGGDYQYDPSAAPAMANNPLIGADRVMPTFTTPAASSSAGAGAARADADAGVAVAAGGGGTKGKSAWRTGRLQNDVLSVMVDNGKCLSMHQPWASLLVRGIKQHEGRSWYSAHRGRLWIAATAKEVDPEEVEALQEFYKEYHADGGGQGEVIFPEHYPSACLLGCIDVDNVVSQEDYAETFEDGESSSPFVFLCKNPQELLMKFPIKGKHKIWNMEKTVHTGAKQGIRPVDPGGVRPIVNTSTVSCG